MTDKRTRRDFLATVAASSVALAVPASREPFAKPNPESPMNAVLPPAFAAEHDLKALPFDPFKLDGLSEKLIRSHWENNYGGSVKALNAVRQKLSSCLDDADLPPYLYNALKREHLMRTGSVVLHERYFGNLGGDGKPGDPLPK